MWYVMSYILSAKSLHNSTLWYVLCWNGEVFSWKSIASIIALCTSETEIICVVSCVQDVNFCRKLVTVVFFQTGPTPIYNRSLKITPVLSCCLNTDTLRYVPNKCIWCFVCDYTDTGVICLVQTPSRDQLVDVGTKTCPAPQVKLSSSSVLFFEVVFD